MKQKVGQVFYLKYVYGSTKGAVTRGDIMTSPHVVHEKGYDAADYSSEYVTAEHVANADATSATGNLTWTPVRPGTISLKTGTQTITDNGSGVLSGSGGGWSATGTIDYSNGQYSVTFGSGKANAELEADYEFNMEYAPAAVPQVDLKVEEVIIQARPRKLRALYAFDSSYDLKISQGIDMDEALLEAASSEIKHEIDGEIMKDLLTQAGGTPVSWNRTPPPAVAMIDHKDTFVDMLVSASNSIFQTTRRAVGNFAIAGKKFADVAESMGGRWVSAGVSNVQGPHFAGTLDGKWKVYKNPYFAEDKFLVGYKGDILLDAGFVYAPYLPLFATSLVMMDDFMGRRGFATSYGKKMLNNRLYVPCTITQS